MFSLWTIHVLYFCKALGRRTSKTMFPGVWHENTQIQLWSKLPIDPIKAIFLGSPCYKDLKTYSYIVNFALGHIHGKIWPQREILTIFWVKIRALVRPHLRSSTGFDVLIILEVKFWRFSFFYYPSLPRLKIYKKLVTFEKSPWRWRRIPLCSAAGVGFPTQWERVNLLMLRLSPIGYEWVTQEECIGREGKPSCAVTVPYQWVIQVPAQWTKIRRQSSMGWIL